MIDRWHLRYFNSAAAHLYYIVLPPMYGSCSLTNKHCCFFDPIQASCPDPVVPLHGRVLDSKPGNRHGQQVTFACDPGFKLTGSSSMRCNNGIWNSTAPLCTGIKLTHSV